MGIGFLLELPAVMDTDQYLITFTFFNGTENVTVESASKPANAEEKISAYPNGTV